MVSVAGLTAANEAWLRGDELQALFAANPLGLAARKLALVDPG